MTYTRSPAAVASLESSLMQLAVADGPNHWPGCLPQAEAPCWTKRWMEKGAAGSSAKRERMDASVGGVVGGGEVE